MLYALGAPRSFVLLVLAFLVVSVLSGWLSALACRRVGLAEPGRSRPDPRRQLDPFGCVAAAIAGTGWAKPVEVPSQRRGGAVAAAVLTGPVVVLLVGLVALAGFGAAHGPVPASASRLQQGVAGPFAQQAWYLGALMATYVGALQLVPLPPLPGGSALFALAPRTPGWQRAHYQLVERNIGVAVLLALLLIPLGSTVALLPRLLDTVLDPLVRAVSGGLMAVFAVHLDGVFEGPFDLLLGLIARHQLDVTEVALSQVTDEFLAHIRSGGPEWDLGQATEFLVVAATLLDLKVARLLPGSDAEADEEDLALLEARDLLFARLLQYRAYKQAAAHLAGLLERQATRYHRSVQLEPRFAGLLPEVLLGLGPQEFAALAARALTPRPAPVVVVDHAHGGAVSVREQTAVLVERLRAGGSGSFRALTADCDGTLEVVARFLGLLELYRDGLVAFEQAEALAELQVRWTGRADGPVDVAIEEDA